MNIVIKDEKYIITDFTTDPDFQLKLIKFLLKKDKRIIFEYIEPDPYLDDVEEINNQIDMLIEEFINDTVFFQFRNTVKNIEKIIRKGLQESNKPLYLHSNSEHKINTREALKKMINGYYALSDETIKRIKKDVFEVVHQDITSYYLNYAKKRMVYKNHFFISKDAKNPLLINETINTIWYSPKNENELCNIINNKEDFNCIISERNSEFTDYSFIISFFDTESDYTVIIQTNENINFLIDDFLRDFDFRS